MPKSRRKTPFKTLKKKSLRLPFLLILAGALLVSFPSLYRATSNIPPRNVGPISIDKQLLTNKDQNEPPKRILIPKYKLDLSVIEAKAINGFWELSESSASHGVGSGNPGEKGNIVVFAHARDELFGPIRDIKKGDAIYLLTKNSWHEYRVSETKLVDPNQIEVIAPTPKETLTLFTCSGFLDSKRLIVKALPRQ